MNVTIAITGQQNNVTVSDKFWNDGTQNFCDHKPIAWIFGFPQLSVTYFYCRAIGIFPEVQTEQSCRLCSQQLTSSWIVRTAASTRLHVLMQKHKNISKTATRSKTKTAWNNRTRQLITW